MSDLHVVFGTGPSGTRTAAALAEKGLRVRAVNRSGRRPEFMPAEVEVVSADVSDPQQAIRAATGASVVYQALNPSYRHWIALFAGLQSAVVAAAKAAGSRYVSLENLYMYGRADGPIREDSPIRPASRKGELRAEMSAELQELHRSGELQVAQVRSSDYYGPGVTGSAMGERTFEPLVAGKRAMLTGSAETLHSYAYIEDVGVAVATLGTSDRAFGEVWITPHAPARTGRDTLAPAFRAAGKKPRVSVMGVTTLRLAGLFIPDARESVEMMYEFTQPFVVDSGKIERSFGLTATPLEDGMRATAEWYAHRQ